MKTALSIALFIFSLLFPSAAPAQSNDYKDERAALKQAYLSYQIPSMENAHNSFVTAWKKDHSPAALCYLTFAEYKLLEMSLSPGNDGLFDKYYDSALAHAEKLTGIKQYSAYGNSLSAAIYMMKIATSPVSAVTLSPKIHALLDEAQQTDPGNAFSYFIRGSMKYNTPGVFGGSYEDALANFNKAIKLYEKDDKGILMPDWGYAENLIWSGRALNELGNKDAAKFTFKKALDKEPDYGWVKYVLLPQMEAKN